MDRKQYLAEALKVYEKAPSLVRRMMFRFRDFTDQDAQFPAEMEKFRFFALGSEILPYLGVTEDEVEV